MTLSIRSGRWLLAALALASAAAAGAGKGPGDPGGVPICKSRLAAAGEVGGFSHALQSARGKWEQQAAAAHGGLFSHWNNSGQRDMACRRIGGGMGSGVFHCTASASPCLGTAG
jgi:hypothetical protein